jgi:hypothetical protein
VTKVAEALDKVDAYDPTMVVRVNGLRALGDGGISVVARYFDNHFGSVKCEVPVLCQGIRGKTKPSNFGFIVMSCTAEADRILAHNTFIVDQHVITVRAYAVKQHDQDSCQGVPKHKVSKVAEALDKVDTYESKTVVRVTGLRAFGDEGISMVSQYLDRHFGSVKREVPVVCQDASGQQKPSNFSFFTLICTVEAEQRLEHDAHIVNGQKITIRVHSKRK